MTPATVFVELVRALVPVLHPFVQHGYDIFLACALNYHQVFNKKAVFHIPTALQDSTARVQ